MLRDLMKDKKRIVLCLIIVVEIFFIVGLIISRISESEIDMQEGIISDEQNKDNLNNEKEDENNGTEEDLSKGQIKILLSKIKIREAANETSFDIGSAFIYEVFDVLEMIDTKDYIWYKINRNGITGYVASKKEENWIEYKSEKNNITQKYQCASSDCKIYDTTNNMALIYENDRLLIYDFITNEKRYLNIDVASDIIGFNFVSYENKIYGVASKKEYNYVYVNYEYINMYYSLEQDKILYDDNAVSQEVGYEGSAVEIIVDDLPFIRVKKYWDRIERLGATGRKYQLYDFYKNHEIDIINIINHENVSTISGATYLESINMDAQKYYIAPRTGRIYDNNYKLVDHISFSEYIDNTDPYSCVFSWHDVGLHEGNYIVSNNKLAVIAEDRFIVYDRDLNQLHSSETYEKIYLVDNYVVEYGDYGVKKLKKWDGDYIITKNKNKLAINDLNGNIIVEFNLDNEEIIIKAFLLEKSQNDIFKISVAIPIANNEYEYKYYYYNVNTGESGLKESSDKKFGTC